MNSSFNATFPPKPSSISKPSCARQGQCCHCNEGSWEKIHWAECPFLVSSHWKSVRVSSGEISGRGRVSSGTPRAQDIQDLWPGCVGQGSCCLTGNPHCELFSVLCFSFATVRPSYSRTGQNKIHLQIQVSAFSWSGNVEQRIRWELLQYMAETCQIQVLF